jgi:SAM-dependent methyltransferase/uncharacterized protein YbaR (Trm112 family)
MWTAELVCPVCLQPLAPLAEGAAAACAVCGHSYSFREGIYDFLAEEDQGRDQPGITTTPRLDFAMHGAGWLPAMSQLSLEQPDLAAQIIDQVQIGWLFHCYEEHAHTACLNIGSGWGALSHALSRFFQTVYSLETNREQLRLQAWRARAEGVANLVCLHCSPLSLPLAGAALDLVIVQRLPQVDAGANGARDKIQPLALLLNHLRRVVKPDGAICLCVDERTGSSVDEAERLLRRTGFANIARYWVWPGHDTPRAMGSADGRSVKFLASQFCNLVDHPLARAALIAASRLPDCAARWGLPLFTRSTLLVASQQPRLGTPQQTVLHMAPGASSFVRLNLSSRPSRLAHTTFLLLDRASVAKAVRVREIQPSASQTGAFIYQQTEGVKGRLLRPSSRGDVQNAARWLASFHQGSCQGVWQMADLAQELEELRCALRRLSGRDSCEALLPIFAEQYVQALQGISLPVVTEHGDYTPPNILVTPQGSLRVFDWEYSRERGNPLIDVGAFSLSLLRRAAVDGEYQAGPAQGSVMTFFREYQRRIPIPLFLAPAYYVLRWLARIAMAPPEDELEAHLAFVTTVPLLAPALCFSLAATGAMSALHESA